MATFDDINLGTGPNQGDGDGLRAGGAKINANNAKAANIEENNTFIGDNTLNGSIELNTMPGFQSMGTIQLGRDDEAARYHSITTFNDSVIANNYIKFNVHNGTLDTTIIPLELFGDGAVRLPLLKSGATQGGAGAAAGELWITSSHASLPDNVIMIGV